MLEAIRNRSNGPIAKFIIGLIIVPFAFAGVYSYFNTPSNTVATVNGADISLVEFDRSYRDQQQRWGDNFDTYFNSDERLQQFRLNVLQQLINRQLSSQAINEMGLRTSDKHLRDLIMSETEFQNEDGLFDRDRYDLLVRSRGFSVNQYQALRKNDLASTQFMEALGNSNFVLPSEKDINVKLLNQSRDIDYLIIPQDYYKNLVKLEEDEADEAIASYFELNKSRFAIAEKVSIEYIYLKRKEPSSIVIADGQVLDYYNENIDNYEIAERRHLAHILVSLPAEDDKQAIAAAELKINTLASRLEAGESFESLAEEGSEDSSTADMGGDLDWIERGMMDAEFEDAAFELDENNPVSSIVKSNFGYHIIKLLEVDAAGAQPLTDVREQIITSLQTEFVEDKFLDLKDVISEKAFEISDSITDTALESGLLVKETNLFDRQFGAGLPAQLASQPQILEQAFSDEVLFQGLNSEMIELADGSAVVLRMLKHQEAGISLLADVQEQIRSLILNQRVREATESSGLAVITALKKGDSSESTIGLLPEDLPVSWQQQLNLKREGTEVNAQLRNEVFRMPTPKDENVLHKGILLQSGDYAVVTLTNVTEGTMLLDDNADGNADEKFAQIDKQLSDYNLQVELYGYLKYLDEKASVSRLMTNINLIQ